MKSRVGETANDTFKDSFIHELTQQPTFRKKISMQSTVRKMQIFFLLYVLEYGLTLKTEFISSQTVSYS